MINRAAVNTSLINVSAPLWRRNDNTAYDIVSRPGHPGFQVQPTVNASTAWWIVDAVNYTLLQFHFHRPAEHTVNGKTFAAEAHFVHRNGNTGGVVVFGILYEVDPGNAAALDNPFLSSYWGSIHTPTPAVYVNVTAMTDDVSDYYFRYSGSLTTPPCTEVSRGNMARRCCGYIILFIVLHT